MRTCVFIAICTALAGASPLHAQPDSAAANRRALAALLHMASTGNQLPPALTTYSAHVETEVAVLSRRQDASEFAYSLEQVASTLRWTRAGTSDQRVIGYREQQSVLMTSVLTSFPAGWLNPTLYGNRLRLRSTFDSSASTPRNDSARSRDALPAIHPLAEDRERYYTYSGGDTLVTIIDGARRIPISRVHVRPRRDLDTAMLLFEGDLDLDVTRGALVRMRGYFLLSGVAKLARQAARIAGAYAFVEFENAEYDGAYWLPIRQRLELQVQARLFSESRAVFRIATRFTDLAVNDTVLDPDFMEHADSLRTVSRRRLVWAPRAALDRFDQWQFPMGAISSGLHSDDFNTVAPDFMRPFGPPRLDVAAQFASDVIRYNRVEGLFTGLGLTLALRDLAPGVVANATGGWAWNERTVRGRLSIDRTRSGVRLGVRAERALETTNDFQRAIDVRLPALGFDNAVDFVDRRSAGVIASALRPQSKLLLRGEIGVADDRNAPTLMTRSPFGGTDFRANHGVDEGNYVRTAAILEWQPDLAEPGAVPGYSARVHYQRGDGTLAFQRIEARAVGHRYLGPLRLVATSSAGIVTGKQIPAQRLFELSHNRSLPGYDSSFAGSRAAVASVRVVYTSRYFKRPIAVPLLGRIPGVSPAIAAGAHGAWADANTDAAQSSLRRLGVTSDSTRSSFPAPQVTNGIRASGSVGLQFFSGLLFFGFARPLDRPGPWRFTMAGGN